MLVACGALAINCVDLNADDGNRVNASRVDVVSIATMANAIRDNRRVPFAASGALDIRASSLGPFTARSKIRDCCLIESSPLKP